MLNREQLAELVAGIVMCGVLAKSDDDVDAVRRAQPYRARAVALARTFVEGCAALVYPQH